MGLRVDEALPLVDRLLDQAVLNGAEHVDIIHGVGTGRLKKAVWEHLKRHGAGEGTPRRRQPRGDGGGFEGLRFFCPFCF